MYTHIYKNMAEQFERNTRPYTNFNQSMANNIESLANLYIGALKAFSDEGVGNLKSLCEVKDLSSLTACYGQQLQSISRISQHYIDDMQRLNEIAKNLKADLDGLVSSTNTQTNPA